MDALLLGIFPEVDVRFDRECAQHLERCPGGIEDCSFDELDMWDREFDRFRSMVCSQTGEEV